MRNQDINISCVKAIDNPKPVWNEQSQYGSANSANAAWQHIGEHQNPNERDIEKHLWEEHTRYTEHQKCVEDVSDSLFVLICLKELQIEDNKTNLYDATIDIGEVGFRQQCKHKKWAWHHSAINTDERISVVQFNHQICWNAQQGKGSPQLVFVKSKSQTYKQCIYGC